MGWWKLPGNEGFVMGDQPADAIGVAVEQITKLAPLPTMDELLAAFERAIANMPEDAVTGARGHLVVEGWPARVEVDPAPDLVAILERGIRDVVQSYRKYIGRSPHVAEVLEVLGFEIRPFIEEVVTTPHGKFTAFAIDRAELA